MKKKTSALAIVVAVIFSIFLFPLILAGGIGSGTVFSMASVFQQDREEELYQSFVNNGGIDFVYDLLSEQVEGEIEEMGITLEEFFPRTQVETMVYDVYHALVKGENYQADLSTQKDVMRELSLKQFEENVENVLREEYGEAYDLLDESQKAEAIAAAREEFVKETEAIIEEEFGALEVELSESINSIYDMEEFRELKELEAETGFSLTDRTELCYYLNLGGYILLGLTGVFLLVLLLCHLFRPSGFFTAGAFSLITGGLMLGIAKVMQGGVLLSLISSELSAEFSAEEFPRFIMPMLEDVLGWIPAGFEKVGKIGLMAAILLILVGILLLVIRRNKANAEPVSAVEMQ